MNRMFESQQFAVMFRLSPKHMSICSTKAGTPPCIQWWLGQVELKLDRVADNWGLDEDGNLCVEFWLDSDVAVSEAMATVKQFMIAT